MRGSVWGGSLPVAQPSDPQRCATPSTSAIHRGRIGFGHACVLGKRDTVCRWKEEPDVRLQSTLRFCLV